MRHLRPVEPDRARYDEQYWKLSTPPSAGKSAEWSLQIAVDDPLFDLPPLMNWICQIALSAPGMT